MMGRYHLVFAAALATGFTTLPGFAQTAHLLTTYQQAMHSGDWPGAIAAAQQLVNQDPTSTNLVLLAKAQLDSRAGDDALATSERAVAAAKANRPANGSGDVAIAKWKDSIAEIYLGEGNALLLLKRTPDAIAAYGTAAQYASNPSLAYFNICALYYNCLLYTSHRQPDLRQLRCLHRRPGDRHRVPEQRQPLGFLGLAQ